MEINRSDLIKQMMERFGYTRASATALIDDFTTAIIENMEAGNRISIYGFGVFDVKKLVDRQCPDPVHGELYMIPSHYTPRFYPGRRLKVAVKKWEDEMNRGID